MKIKPKSSLKPKDKKELLLNIAFICFIVAVGVFLFWKCKYGIGNVDESFYLTIPYRLFKGDSLFMDEWHLSQMSGVLTLPFVSLYLKIFGSTEGIILAMRYVCTFLQCLLAVFMYIRLKKITWIGAVIASISFALYTPFSIMALSYNSMGIMFQVLAYTIIFTAEKHKEIQFIFAGVAFAAAVLCCPYLAVLYFIYLVAVLIKFAVQKFKKTDSSNGMFVWNIKGALFLTIGIVSAALTFVVFVLSRASLASIIESFKYIMNDPEHPPLNILSKAKTYRDCIVSFTDNSWLIYLVMHILLLAMLIDNNRKKHRALHFLLSLALVSVLMVINFKRDYINYLMWAINFLAVTVIFLTDKPICKQIFYIFWIPGMVYSFCLHLTSNQYFYAVSSASSVSTVGSIIIISIFAAELMSDRTDKSILKVFAVLAVCFVMTFQLYSQVSLRYSQVFWETGIENQTQKIDVGTNKGIITSSASKNDYLKRLENLKELDKYNAEKVLFLSKKTWYYLTDDYEMCTYSAWLSGVNDHTLFRLEAYYDINPDKLPEIVYADAEYQDIAMKFSKTFNYKIYAADGGYILKP